jgi:nucleoside-diphosphate-sugar epimerase
VELLRADRSSDDFDHVLAARAFDAVVDFAGFTGDDARRAVRVLDTRQLIFISSGQVYLVREGLTGAARETDYAGRVMAAPPREEDRDDWAYGIGKRDAEDVIAAAPFLTTRLRIPMVCGEGDPKQRYEKYLWRILDGGPVFVPNANAIARHVYRGSVVDAIVRLVEQPPAQSDAYNLAQAEEPTVREVVELIASAARAPRPELIDEAVAGLTATAYSPFSSRWMSRIDPAKLGAPHEPLERYIHSTVQHLLATWSVPPPGYADRALERRLPA